MDIDKRLAELLIYVAKCEDDEALNDQTKFRFYAILCQLNMLSKDLEDYYLIKKCRCCCADSE